MLTATAGPSAVREAARYWSAMCEEVATPDLVERMRESFEAWSSGDFDTITSFCAPDAVYESVAMGARFEGIAAIREFWEDILGAFEEFDAKIEENLDFGNGIGLAVVNQKGRSAGGVPGAVCGDRRKGD